MLDMFKKKIKTYFKIKYMKIKELKEKIANIPDDVDVKMLKEGGYLITVDTAYLDEDNFGNKVFVISH